MVNQYEIIILVARYIENHPRQTASQIIEGLEGRITNTEFSIADDMLTDIGAIKKPWRKTGDGWGNRYIFCDSLEKIKPLVKKILSRK